MIKEEILKNNTDSFEADTRLKSDVLEAMQEYADQEKEKVAVAFAEWKDKNTTKDENDCFVIWYRNADTFAYNNSDLYKYFITNVYNK